ncbi:MAG: extradiol dioxygenase [Bryobacteraceae bacterium]
MITGTHILLNSKEPEADRAFFRDVLEFRAVDASRGWLIFALPPADVACSAVTAERWGIRTTIQLPSGGELGLYQPKHPTAI